MASPTGRRKPTGLGVRPGRLVIVGSGIKSMSQFTLEAVSHIEQADKVSYCVADPATDTFIEKHAKEAVDLYDLYDDGKPRHQTYTQMAEKMLREVRKGFYVVGCFYGHPGVFVNPSHRAIAIAASTYLSNRSHFLLRAYNSSHEKRAKILKLVLHFSALPENSDSCHFRFC